MKRILLSAVAIGSLSFFLTGCDDDYYRDGYYGNRGGGYYGGDNYRWHSNYNKHRKNNKHKGNKNKNKNKNRNYRRY